MEKRQEEEIDLLKLAKVLIGKLWLLVLAAVFCGGLAYVYTTYFVEPEYQATSKLYVFNKAESNTTGAVSSSDISTSKILVNTYIVVLQSNSVLDQVCDVISQYQGQEGFEFLGTEEYTSAKIRKMLSAGAINSTESFSVTVTAHDPYEAKFINDAILFFLPDEIIRVVKAGAVEIIDKASIPTSPSSPSIIKNTIVGVLAGGVLAAGFVVVASLLDTVIHSEEDLAEELPGIPIIGVIPVMQDVPAARASSSVRSARKSKDDDDDDDDED